MSSALRNVERVLAVALTAFYLGYLGGLWLKAHPEISSKLGFYSRRAARVAQWRAMYPHLPTWAQEAAQVRGLAPVDTADTIDLSAFRE